MRIQIRDSRWYDHATITAELNGNGRLVLHEGYRSTMVNPPTNLAVLEAFQWAGFEVDRDTMLSEEELACGDDPELSAMEALWFGLSAVSGNLTLNGQEMVSHTAIFKMEMPEFEAYLEALPVAPVETDALRRVEELLEEAEYWLKRSGDERELEAISSLLMRISHK